MGSTWRSWAPVVSIKPAGEEAQPPLSDTGFGTLSTVVRHHEKRKVETEPQSQLFELKQEMGARWGCTSLFRCISYPGAQQRAHPEGGGQDEEGLRTPT